MARLCARMDAIPHSHASGNDVFEVWRAVKNLKFGWAPERSDETSESFSAEVAFF